MREKEKKKGKKRRIVQSPDHHHHQPSTNYIGLETMFTKQHWRVQLK